MNNKLQVANPNSLENVREKWSPEVKKYYKAPILLVGTQIDLREDAGVKERLAKSKLKPTTKEQVNKITQEVACVK